MPYAPQVWTPAPVDPIVTRYDGRGMLDDPLRIPVPGHGPEDVVLDDEGGIYTGLDDGSIVRIDLDGAPTMELANTGGRPLGLEWLPDGDLLVCDAARGLLRVPRTGGVPEVVVAEFHGSALRLTNNAAVAADGTIWFTESTRQHDLADFVDDVMEHNGTGRLLRRDVDGTVSEVLDGLSFANGVTLTDDHVWVAETAAYALHRVDLHGPTAGRVTRLTGGLPGYPDNLSTGADGTVWCAIPSPRNPVGDMLTPRAPILRHVAVHLPEALRPKPARRAEVIGFAPDGSVRHHLTGDGLRYHFVTTAREHDGWLYLGSQSHDIAHLARVPVPILPG